MAHKISQGPPTFQLTLTLSSDEEEEESFYDNLYRRITTSKRLKMFFEVFIKTVPTDSLLGVSKEKTLDELIEYFFPNRSSKKLPAIEEVVDAIENELRSASKTETILTLEALCSAANIETVFFPNGKVAVADIKKHVPNKHIDYFFARVIKLNQKIFKTVDQIMFDKGEFKTLPKGLALLKQPIGFYFINCKIQSLPFWVGNMQLVSLRIRFCDTAFKIDRFFQNLKHMLCLKIWEPLEGSLNPLIHLKDLLVLELPELEFELPEEIRKLPRLQHIATNINEVQENFTL